MAQLREPTRAMLDGGRNWLSSLVQTLDAAEQLTDVPCDPSALRSMRARLSRPTSTVQVSRLPRIAQRYSPASCSRGS